MALWQRIQQLDGESLKRLRAIHENVDDEILFLRQTLPDWLEEEVQSHTLNLDLDSPSDQPAIHQFFLRLANQIEAKADSYRVSDSVEDMNLSACRTKETLLEAAKSVRVRFYSDPPSLLRLLRCCFRMEQCFLEEIEASHVPQISTDMMVDSKTKDASEKGVIRSHGKDEKTGEMLEKIWLMLNETQKFLQEVNCSNANALTTWNYLINSVNSIVDEVPHVQNLVLAELTQWTRTVRRGRLLPFTMRTSTGGTFKSSTHYKEHEKIMLNAIQVKCEQLADILHQVYVVLKNLQDFQANISSSSTASRGNEELESNGVQGLQQKVKKLLSKLVKATFMVYQQPPQVTKTLTSFDSLVRLLIGGGRLDFDTTTPVSVAIISEEEGALLRATGSFPAENSAGTIQLKSDKRAEPGTANRQKPKPASMSMEKNGRGELTAKFRNLKVTDIKRESTNTMLKNSKTVKEEKYCLLFRTNVKIGSVPELCFDVWTLSVPMVVIVHRLQQETASWATILWVNAFGQGDTFPFQVPDQVPCRHLAEVLGSVIESKSGRPLTHKNVQALCQTLMEVPAGSKRFDSETTITWSRFCKDRFQANEFTFWEWFYAILKLMKKHLMELWVNGLIDGFVGREEMIRMLELLPVGTFSLRFSDTILGGISISWVQSCKNGEQETTCHLVPLTSKDLTNRSLSKRIRDTAELVNLYPDTPKLIAFPDYPTAIKPSPPTIESSSPVKVTPYLPTELIMRLKSEDELRSRTVLSANVGGNGHSQKPQIHADGTVRAHYWPSELIMRIMMTPIGADHAHHDDTHLPFKSSSTSQESTSGLS